MLLFWEGYTKKWKGIVFYHTNYSGGCKNILSTFQAYKAPQYFFQKK